MNHQRRDYRNQGNNSDGAQSVGFVPLTPNELQETKQALLNCVSAALIQTPKVVVTDPMIIKISDLVKIISFYDPEFILKLAVYIRLDLNIRSTANYLIALASNIKECQPFVRKYFSSAVRLPSDWLDCAATYYILPDRELSGKAIPTCLRKSMIDRFPGFDAYQLGKYNKERTIKRKLKKQKEFRLANPGVVTTNDKPMLTIKQMIRQLHISQPHYNVMCILGKKYPANKRQFIGAGLDGEFEPERAGKRMKLPTPETWETLLSEKGNKASTWEELIEHKKLPFMAMLRNIRNLINAGVQPKYHRWVQNRLSNAIAVANSRQFPFRFFSAYEVIPRDIEHFKQLLSGTGDDNRRRRKNIVPAHMPNNKVFDDYRAALDQSVKLATIHNVQPIKGSTIVLSNVSPETRETAPGARGMGSSVRNIQEVGYLLGLMCKYVCEDCEFKVFASTSKIVELIEGTILDNMSVVADVAATVGNGNEFPYEMFQDLIRDKRRIDNILLLSHRCVDPADENRLSDLLTKYRLEVNPDLLFVSVDLSGSGRSTIGTGSQSPNDIMITGFSDQILRFIAERGDSTQLQYVEHIDEAKKIKNPTKHLPQWEVSPWWKWLDSLSEDYETVSYPNITTGPKWREARVFISSTFTDMHGERDVLTRIVFPELKERASKRRVEIVDVDLRWGVTEEEAQKGMSIQLCLDEVDRCKPFFIGMLGERYGWMPESYDAPHHPRFDWLKHYPQGRSITELEISHGVLNDPDYATGAFFYFRDPQFLLEVPEDNMQYFSQQEGYEKLQDLKMAIIDSGKPTLMNYPCTYGGIVDGKPTVTGLDEFAEKVFNDLWESVQLEYPEIDTYEENYIDAERSYHQAFASTLIKRFWGRVDVLKDLTRFVEGLRGNFFVLHGKAGDGKSAIMATLANSLAEKDSSTFVLPHFIGSSPGSTSIRQTLFRLCSELKHIFKLEDEIPEDYKSLAALFPSFLEQACFQGKLILVIDGLDQLDDSDRGKSLEWLPTKSSCKIVLSTREGICLDILQDRGVRALQIPSLSNPEKRDIVRNTLAIYHKKLDERGMNTQMRVLLRKFDSSSPLYLTIACEELRVFGVYEKVSERIKKLGTKIPSLFEEVIERLENDHGKELVQDSLTLIHSSRNGLTENELRDMIDVDSNTWSRFMRSLAAFLKPEGEFGELSFFYEHFGQAVQKKYFVGRTAIRVHEKLVHYFYNSVDPARDGSWSKGGSNDRALSELPYHLIHAKKYKELVSVLTDLSFIELKVSLGMAYDLLYDYAEACSNDIESYNDQELVREYRDFVQANIHVITRNPSLTFQQASNLPSHCTPAEDALDKWSNGSESRTYVKWENKPQKSDFCKMTFSGFGDGLTCSTFSPDGSKLVCASRDCSLKLFDAETRNELLTLHGHSNWIVDVQFSPDSRNLVSASWDNSLILWDLDVGLPYATLTGHRRRVTSCAFSSDGLFIVSGSWDCSVKIWHSTGECFKTITAGGKPINSVSFAPDDKVVVVGSWDGSIKFIDIDSGEILDSLVGHKKSVQSVSYAPDGKHLVTGSLDRSVLLWDAQARKPITPLSKHSKPVTYVDYSKDGNQLLSASEDGTVRVWKANLGQKRNTIKVSNGYMNSVNFHPNDSNIIVTGSSECKVILWNVRSGLETMILEGHIRPVTYVEFSPRGTEIASASEDGTVIIWNAENGNIIHKIEAHRSGVNTLSWSPLVDDHRLVSGSEDFSLKIWNTTTGEMIHELLGHDNVVGSVSFSPNGKLVVSASRDNTLRIWHSKNGTQLNILQGHKDWLNGCHFSQGSKPRIVSCSWDYNMILWNSRKGAAIGTMIGHTSAVNFCRFSPDGKNVVSASYDGSLKVWDAESSTEITTLEGHESRVNACAYSHDGKQIVSVSDDGTIRIWDPLASTEVGTLIGHSAPIRTATFGEGCKIITASDDRTMRVWETSSAKTNETDSFFGYGSSISFMDTVEDEEVEETQGFSGHSAQINDIRFNLEGDKLVTASDDGKCIVWDVETQKDLRIFVADYTATEDRPILGCDLFQNTVSFTTDLGDVLVCDIRTGAVVSKNSVHNGPATSCRINSAGVVVSTGWDKQIFYNGGMYTNHTDWHTKLSLSLNQKFLAVGSWDHSASVIDTVTGNSICSVAHTDTITDVTFSQDSRFLGTSSIDSTVKIWNTYSGNLENTMIGHEGRVNTVHFAARATNRIISGGADNTVKIWSIEDEFPENEFISKSSVTSVHSYYDVGFGDLSIVAGDVIGNIYFTRLVQRN
eukprot:TRINITY_DN8098_c0_g1_i1.p1 TRINITY_DN8098_c0_g1~~TRINITY_DN8098_c0_g1_i1.p1  ORF type:complete len:2262 (-),score=513.74 TRINITY_DN8098_c0_g1_i1:41-6826(-)